MLVPFVRDLVVWSPLPLFRIDPWQPVVNDTA